MREASTVSKTEKIINLLIGSNLKTQLKLEWDNDGTWERIEDLDEKKGVGWSKSAKKYKYAAPTLTPKASQISFNILNRSGKYSVGSGTSVEGIFDLDTRVRLQAGYIVDDDTQSRTDTITADILHHLKDTSGTLNIDGSNYIANDSYFTDLFQTKGDVTYATSNKYTGTAFAIYTRDFEGLNFYSCKSFSITANSDKFSVYFREVQSKAMAENGLTLSTNWTLAGSSVNGVFNQVVNTKFRFFQVAVYVDNVPSWDSDIEITNVSFTYDTFIEWVYFDVFYLDTPKFTDPQAPQMPTIKCSGRDAYKKIIETDMQLADVNTLFLDDILKTILTRANVSFNATSIADLSSFGARTLTSGFDDTVSAEQILEKIMQIITQGTGDRFQMFLEYDDTLEDNIFHLISKPNLLQTDFVFNYKHYTGIGDTRRNYDKMLSRVTIASGTLKIDERQQLDTQAVTVDSVYVLSWIGNAIYLEFETDLDIGTAVFNITAQTPTSISFSVTNFSTSFTIIVYGSRFDTAPTFYGEWNNINNGLNSRGLTAKIKNELLNSDDEAFEMANGLMTDFALPVLETNSLQYPYAQLMLEINDMTLLWARFIFNDDLRYITGIKYQWSASQDSTTFNLDDSGLNFSDVSTFIYDETAGDLTYEKGFVYDQGISTPDSTDAEIDAASILTFDLEVT